MWNIGLRSATVTLDYATLALDRVLDELHDEEGSAAPRRCMYRRVSRDTDQTVEVQR